MNNKRLKDIFLTIKINDNKFILYNSIKHIPIVVNDTQKQYFDYIINIEKGTDKELSNNELKGFKSFVSQLKKIDFLSTKEDYISKQSLLEYFDKYKKSFYLHLTNKCNLKCSYCYNVDKRTSFNDLSLDSWKAILDKILPYTSEIILTGGEPTLYENFCDIVRYIKLYDNRIHLKLISNATLDYKKKGIDKVLPLFNRISFSCDDLSGEPQERIGFNHDVFISNLHLINELGLKGKLNISSVFQRNKLSKINDIQRFCSNNGYSSMVSLFIPNAESEKKKMPTLKEYNLLKTFFCNDNRNQDKSIAFKTTTCKAASSTFSIDSEGFVFPCQSFHFPDFCFGNLLNDSFKDIYYSPKAEMLRVANDVNYIEKCKNCNVKYICSGGCLANTFGIEGGLLKYPKTMCKYYRESAIKRLKNVEF